MSLPLIKLESAKKRYLSHVFDFSIHRGDFILITGGNGVGKTTLISLILGFIKPDTGKVIRHIKKINYAPEKVHLPLNQTVFSYIITVSQLKKIFVDETLMRALDFPLLKTIETLSKGNYQKVALYQTFIGDAELYIFDEPFSGLDYEMVRTVCELFKSAQSKGQTLVISTHQKEAFKDFTYQEIAL